MGVSSGIADSLKVALDAEKQRRNKGSKAHATTAKKPKQKGPKLSKDHARMIAAATTPEARNKCEYEVTNLKVIEVIEGGKVRTRTAEVIRNRGTSTVDRWNAAGSLSQGEVEAIALYSWAHRLTFGEQPRVIANYNAAGTIRGIPANPSAFINTQLEAKELLDQIDREIFSMCNPKWKDCWQNVVLYDEAAGVAGSRLGFKNKGSEAAAKTICMFIADQIAYRWRLG